MFEKKKIEPILRVTRLTTIYRKQPKFVVFTLLYTTFLRELQLSNFHRSFIDSSENQINRQFKCY